MSILFAVFQLSGSGCSLLHSEGNKSATEPVAESSSAETSAEIEKLPADLKQAKFWSRLDALEHEQNRQKARIKLLEQGLLLGIVPDELRDPSDLEHERRRKKKTSNEVEDNKKTEPPQKPAQEISEVKPPVVEKVNDRALFEKEFGAAQEIFREGRYGKAVVAFEEIESKFSSELTGGAPHYWIGLSWYNLKDYDGSEKHLQTIVNKFSASPWIPRAKLYIARIQLRKGLKEQALASLQKIISEHGNEDAADMARADIETLKSSL